MSIGFEETKDQASGLYVEMPEQNVALRIREGIVEEGTNPENPSFVIKWEFEGCPGTVTDKDGNKHDATALFIGPWWYINKSGKNRKGKQDGRWTQLVSLAKKLGISGTGISSSNITQEFISQFVGRAFVAENFSGERKVKLDKQKQPVMEADGVTPSTFVDYNFWQVKEAAPQFDVK